MALCTVSNSGLWLKLNYIQSPSRKTVLIFASSTLLSFGRLHQWDPFGPPDYTLTPLWPLVVAVDLCGSIVFIGLGGDLHFLDDELQEVVLFLQYTGHLFHPAWKRIRCSVFSHSPAMQTPVMQALLQQGYLQMPHDSKALWIRWAYSKWALEAAHTPAKTLLSCP